MPNAAFSQIYNRSMSEVIVRSLATSFCAALPILALLLFGGDTLKDFAFALLVGTLSGTYSSVFIAGPVLTHWKEREPVYKARERRIRQQFGGELPPYAVPMAGAPVDVVPKESKRRRDRVTQPMDPSQGVSKSEFDEMVRDLGIEEEEEKQPAAARSGRPAGGRRARSRGIGTPPTQSGEPRPPQQNPQQDDGGSKPKKPRNRRHGRPR
jgi:SecD/SecF fusion protein